MVMPTEGRVCESKSHHYEGACLADHNCAMVCRTDPVAIARAFVAAASTLGFARYIL